MGEIPSSVFRKAAKNFEEDWDSFVKINVASLINKQTKKLLSKHPLRSFDAIHLASALFFRSKVNQKVLFLSYDQKQNEAAGLEELDLSGKVWRG